MTLTSLPEMEMEFTDRYAGLKDIPCPWRACPNCQALGVVPISNPDPLWQADMRKVRPEDAVYFAAWREAEAREPSEDGWHFLPCRACGGSRRRPWLRSLLDLPWRLCKAAGFAWRFVILGDGGWGRRVALGATFADFSGPENSTGA